MAAAAARSASANTLSCEESGKQSPHRVLRLARRRSAAVSACRLQVRSCCSGCVEPQYRRALTRLLPALTARTSEHLLVQVKGSRLSEKRDSTCFSKYPQTMHVYVQVTVNHDHQERSRKLCDDVIESSGARDSLYLIKP